MDVENELTTPIEAAAEEKEAEIEQEDLDTAERVPEDSEPEAEEEEAAEGEDEEGKEAEEDDSTPAKKRFTQEELEAIVGKRLARERRRLERDAAAELAANQPVRIESKLNADDFPDTDSYLDALADERAEAKLAQREKVTATNKQEQHYLDMIEDAEEKYPDYIEVAHTHQFMTAEMAEAIKTSEIATDLGYYLGKNLKEAEQISKLPAIQQVRALGKLEAKLEGASVKTPASSKTPAPLHPLRKAKVKAKTFDTTDPESSKQMSATEWINRDRARRAKILKSKGFK